MANNFFSTGSYSIYSDRDTTINFQAIDNLGNIVNITGYTFYYMAKSNPSLPDNSASLSIVQTSASNAVNGQTTFFVSASMTTNLIPGKYFYDISSVDPNGNSATWENDAFYLVKSINTTIS